MKTYKQLLSLVGLLSCFAAFGHPPGHAKHGMLLVGTNEIFASHLVYKDPHHYQVILRVDFDASVEKAYLDMHTQYPNEHLILMLDHMDLGKLSEKDTLTGTLVRRDAAGVDTTFLKGVRLEPGDFVILYFEQLPLSLSAAE